MIFKPGTKVRLRCNETQSFFNCTMDSFDIAVVESHLEADLTIKWYKFNQEYRAEVDCSRLDEVEDPNEIIKALI